MIFVTVGTGSFDELVKAVDELKAVGKIKEEIIIQIGSGKYTPKFCKWFRFAPSLGEYYKNASLIISHGGPGIVYEILDLGKPLIAVPNLKRTDPRHQVEFLEAVSESGSVIYCRLEELEKTLKMAKTFKFKRYIRPECRIHEKIIRFLNK